ncbi:class F sortase [Aquibacillus albus]|uniref:LPXTG-site transpeptidase (Sortase) family protein n=1 Tax=Aquibacillus albus TaxID=1168171 RepID=A0ABS2N527_9BACI|nr:class F sortase [Aquibacillus albus]MBM7573237.1 LPXTG-site transpeptidase (sortase) family protein [Aquibacillus albus]
MVIVLIIGLTFLASDLSGTKHTVSNHQSKQSNLLSDRSITSSNQTDIARVNILEGGQYPISMIMNEQEIPIEPVKTDQNGKMSVMDDPGVLSWYDTRGFDVKNIIISGHRDWKGELGVFYGMENWEEQKKFTLVMKNGEQRTFSLSSVREYKKDEVPESVMKLQSGENRVTLITCVGDFVEEDGGYQSRVVAILKEIE